MDGIGIAQELRANMSENFEELAGFVRNKMRMSHIYQPPAMLIELLRNGGVASVSSIVGALLGKDSSQIEYYEQVSKIMVGRVLTKTRGLFRKTMTMARNDCLRSPS